MEAIDPRRQRPRSLRDFVEEALRHVREISPEEGLQILQNPASPTGAATGSEESPGEGGEEPARWHFVDVREPDEYAAGHVPGALSYPRGFLEVRADHEHPKRDPWLADRQRPLVLYCGGGHRSALAARTLSQMGFARVVSLAGGWAAWTERGYPVER